MHRFTASAIYLALLSGAFALPQAAPTTTAAPSSPSASSGQFDENFATWTEGETIPECGTLKLAWKIPEPQGLPANDTREWTTLVTMVGITPETRARNRNFLDRFNATQLNWEHIVGFPAGTEVTVTLTALTEGYPAETVYNQGRTYTVVERDPSCIPASAYPITIDTAPLQELNQCDEINISFNGSAPPYNVEIITFNTVRRSYDPERFAEYRDTNATSVPWTVSYPAGTRFAVAVYGANSSFASAQDLTVAAGGVNSTSCTPFPRENQLDETLAQNDAPASDASSLSYGFYGTLAAVLVSLVATMMN